VEGGRGREVEEICDICGEPVKKDKRGKNGLLHKRNRARHQHDPEARGAVYRCLTCNNPVLLTEAGWRHENPVNDGHEAKQ
jgi:hypothetical protein